MRRKDIPEKIRARLYPRVLEIFSENDFHQVSIRDIANKTEISLGTLYKYFDSKENLLFTVLEDYLGEMRQIMIMHVAALENPREIFRKIFWVTMDYYDNHPSVAITAYITVPTKTWMQQKAYRRDDIKDILSSVYHDLSARNAIDPQLDVRALSSLYFMFTDRHINVWYYHGMKWKLAERMDDFFDHFWKIIEPPAGAP